MTDDILPSWRDGATRQAIIDFVRRVTDPDHGDYVSPERRIAAFDHDGTLMCEQPKYVQMAFIIDHMEGHIESFPGLGERHRLTRALLDTLVADIRGVSIAQFLDLVTTIYRGPTPEHHEANVRAWLGRARHPRFNVPVLQTAYQPMTELLAYLRRNGFKTVINTGSDIAFIRVFAEEVYGVSRECVIGTAINHAMRDYGAGPILERETSIYGYLNEGSGKPLNMLMHIGYMPVFAAGNSSADIEMLRMTEASKLPSLCLMVEHDDAEREYAYAPRASGLRTREAGLSIARQHGWQVISMKDDWAKVFAFEDAQGPHPPTPSPV